MKNFTAQDLEALADGQPVSSEALRAICADPRALEQLSRLVKQRDLLDPSALSQEAVELPEMEVSLDEVTLYLEGRLLEPGRKEAVERFLRAETPEVVTDISEESTETGLGIDDTRLP